MPPRSDQVLVSNSIAGIPFHVKEAMTKTVLKIFTVQYKRLDTLSSDALELYIERILKMVVSYPETFAKYTKPPSINLDLSHQQPLREVGAKQLERLDSKAQSTLPRVRRGWNEARPCHSLEPVGKRQKRPLIFLWTLKRTQRRT